MPSLLVVYGRLRAAFQSLCTHKNTLGMDRKVECPGFDIMQMLKL
jgi:hypothetical protein